MASITSYTKAALDTKLALLASTASMNTAITTAINALIAAAPGALDTLNELATALGDDPNFATTMTNALALKAPLASPSLTGVPLSTSPTAGDNSTKIATTAFVQGGKVKVVNTQTTSYFLVLTDAEKLIEMNSASGISLQISLNATVAFPIGTQIQVTQIGAGKVTISGVTGVTINSPGALFGTAAQWATVTLRKRGTDLWVLSDDVG